MTFSNRTYDYAKGSLKVDKAGIDINFEFEEVRTFRSLEKKISTFTLILTFMGVIHIYVSLHIIKEVILEDLSPQSVKFNFTLVFCRICCSKYDMECRFVFMLLLRGDFI
jgi:hypothetical protein